MKLGTPRKSLRNVTTTPNKDVGLSHRSIVIPTLIQLSTSRSRPRPTSLTETETVGDSPVLRSTRARKEDEATPTPQKSKFLGGRGRPITTTTDGDGTPKTRSKTSPRSVSSAAMQSPTLIRRSRPTSLTKTETVGDSPVPRSTRARKEDETTPTPSKNKSSGGKCRHITPTTDGDDTPKTRSKTGSRSVSPVVMPTATSICVLTPASPIRSLRKSTRNANIKGKENRRKSTRVKGEINYAPEPDSVDYTSSDEETEHDLPTNRGRPSSVIVKNKSNSAEDKEQERASSKKRGRPSSVIVKNKSNSAEDKEQERASSKKRGRPSSVIVQNKSNFSEDEEQERASQKKRGRPSNINNSNKSKSSIMDLPSPTPVVPNTPGTVWRFNSIGVPECPLPCRESQFEEIWTFLSENISQKHSRCMYVSGVPGTGKTLIVQSVIDCFSRYATERKQNLLFKDVYINGLSLGSPDKIWKKFLNNIEDKKGKEKYTPAIALRKLNSFFETKARLPVVLVIDELDQLLDKKQSILYQLLEWTTMPSYMFSLIAIFNTMSLPENALVMRNASRMGFVRCIFPPYSHDQLQTIIKRSLESCKTDKIQDEAIVLLSRKVAAVSGDARRALEIARRAVEIVELRKISGVMGVNEAFKEIFSSVKIDDMKHCSFLEQAVLKHLTQELESSGIDETSLMSLFNTLCSNATYEAGHSWTKNQFIGAVTKLLMMKLIIAENNSPSMHKKISLNVPYEDVYFALGLKRVDQN